MLEFGESGKIGKSGLFILGCYVFDKVLGEMEERLQFQAEIFKLSETLSN